MTDQKPRRMKATFIVGPHEGHGVPHYEGMQCERFDCQPVDDQPAKEKVPASLTLKCRKCGQEGNLVPRRCFDYPGCDGWMDVTELAALRKERDALAARVKELEGKL